MSGRGTRRGVVAGAAGLGQLVQQERQQLARVAAVGVEKLVERNVARVPELRHHRHQRVAHAEAPGRVRRQALGELRARAAAAWKSCFVSEVERRRSGSFFLRLTAMM